MSKAWFHHLAYDSHELGQQKQQRRDSDPRLEPDLTFGDLLKLTDMPVRWHHLSSGAAYLVVDCGDIIIISPLALRALKDFGNIASCLLKVADSILISILL